MEQYYWPAAQHLEPTTLAAYRSNLDSHFLPHFGRMRMSRIVASTVQAWVTKVSVEVKYRRRMPQAAAEPALGAQEPHAPARDLRASNH